MTDLALDELAELRRLLAEALSEAPDSQVSEGANELRLKIRQAWDRRARAAIRERMAAVIADKQREDS